MPEKNVGCPALCSERKKQDCALRKEPVPSEAEEWGTLFRKLREARATRPRILSVIASLLQLSK